MGVCLGKERMLSGGLDGDGRFIQNATKEAETSQLPEPRCPVIFVLGGPGSGKITHCDRVVQERQGLAHINMTDLIQQHIVGNGLSDFGQLGAVNLIEVLAMEMKMAVNAKAFLVSGYPRSMRDIVVYQSKLHRIDGVILLNWHIKILEKQIEFGSQLGDTVLQLARMELKNYSKNVLGVAEYFDQMGRLIVVDGERQPAQVYEDFLKGVDQLLENPQPFVKQMEQIEGKISKMENQDKFISSNKNFKAVWVIGGPGSNKSLLSSTCVKLLQSRWEFISVGEELRRQVDKPNLLTREQADSANKAMIRGELVDNDLVLAMIGKLVRNKDKVVIDGFPRNLLQVESFKKLTPAGIPSILVDCSEVELGRSLGQRSLRADDRDQRAVRRRLEIYRTITLPTLKVLDDMKRLHIIDGDVAEKGVIVEEFSATLERLMNSEGKNSLLLPNVHDTRKPSTDTIKAMYNEVNE